MSVVIDGKDILMYYSYLAADMKEELEKFLQAEEIGINPLLLINAKRLFAAGMEGLRLSKGIGPRTGDIRESITTYMMLRDMLKKARTTPEKEVDSRLEQLATAAEALTPGWEYFQHVVKKEDYKALKDVFREIALESSKYAPALGQHSSYSIGTFDDADDD